MADKKESSKPTHPAEPIIVLFLVASILGFILMQIEEFLARHDGLAGFLRSLWLLLGGDISFDQFIAGIGSPGLSTTVFLLRLGSYIFSVFMVWAIIVAFRKYSEAHRQLMAPLIPPKEIKYGVEAPAAPYVNPRWAKVLEHIGSNNPSDWRLAVLEADILLGDVLDKVGYPGATIGDKLKSVNPNSILSLNEAWEAHKVRNSIAHEGSEMSLSKLEAERVIRLFEKVFKELKYI